MRNRTRWLHGSNRTELAPLGAGLLLDGRSCAREASDNIPARTSDGFHVTRPSRRKVASGGLAGAAWVDRCVYDQHARSIIL